MAGDDEGCCYHGGRQELQGSMEAAGILGALQTRLATVPGGRDIEGRPLVLVSVPAETQYWDKDHLDAVLRYFLFIFSPQTRRNGLAVVVDATRSTWRMTRACIRQMGVVLGADAAAIIVLRPEAFWDKQRVDNCARTQKEGEPVYVPLCRLHKYVEVSQLPEELGGSWSYSHNQWIEKRLYVEAFTKEAEGAVSDLEKLRQRLTRLSAGMRVSSAEEALNINREALETTKDLAHKVLQAGKDLLQQCVTDRDTATPQDVLDTRVKVERLLEIVQGKETLAEEAWLAMQKRFVDAKEISSLEKGVTRVTNWILGPAETMLNGQQEVGFDVISAEELRQEHETLELQCRDTYGHYAELLHKIDTLPRCDVALPEDLKSQRDFMDFVCRSFATRLERRRNVLITSLRFFRLVSEYFDRTNEVFDCLVRCGRLEGVESADTMLVELQERQISIELLGRDVMKEGEKLADILSMPVKDALGRDVEVNYEPDIANVLELLDAATVRKNIFCDSVELHKLTLAQVAHVRAYERDAAQAVQWLDDLFQVMLNAHMHVGCNVYEIQCQKEEHQSFQETAKGTYEYGCQLLTAALALRQSCKLPTDSNSQLSQKLWNSWKTLETVGQEQMTRLRVSAVFHRSVEEHCNQLRQLMQSVKAAFQGAGLHSFLTTRERLLLEVGRMVRLGRLLRSRLREPLCTEQGSTDGCTNDTAVEAISDKLSEVTELAEQLDASLCGMQNGASIKRILDDSATTTPQEWCSTLKTSSKTVSADDSKSDDDFVTASECTCTPSRSSSFHTASECGGASPWWEVDRMSDVETERRRTVDGGSDQTSSQSETERAVVRTVTEVTTDVVIHEVVETTHLKLSHGDSSGVTSYLLTTERVRRGEGEEKPQTASHTDCDSQLLNQLKESREWLQLKVLEVHPELTKLGASLKEANELQRAHDDVLLQLQSKQSPVEELLRQADQLISTQKPRAEVYAAMAESLGLAWKDVNSHLEQRKLILDLNVAYQSRAEDCVDRMRALEIACQDASLPVDIDTVKQFLTKLHDLRKLVLESLMAALQDGKLLLEKLKDLSAEGTLDSRPDHIKTSAEFAVSQVEHWLENLHDRRRLLEIAWQNRKTHLEQCLALALLASDLKGLEEVLVAGKEAVARSCDHLGNSSASAELLLHEHKKLFPEAKELQDRALKITKATEQLVASGHFAAEQAVAQAYSVLNLSAEYMGAIEQREGLLSRAIAFFRSAHTALTKLDQLEVQLTTTKLSASSTQLIQLHSQVSKSLEEITLPPLQEGYSLLEIVGRGSPGIEGVKRTVDEIENRKIYLGELCTAHREENVHLSQAFTAFLEKQNELFSWLVSIAEAFLQGHQDMGSVLAMAKDFLELHHQLLNDLQKKGAEINALLLTLPPILEFLDDEQRGDVDQKVDALHSHWLTLKSLLESRIDLAFIYVKFHSLAVQLANEFDDAEAEFKKSPDGVSEDTIRLVEQKWLSIQQLYDQLTNVGKNFTEDASKVGDPYLDIKRASLCVETLLEHFGNRQLLISESWQTWQMNVTVEKEFQVRWEMNITESTRTVDCVSKLDEQLYPVLTSDTKSSKAIARELEEKLHTVLSEVKRAQTEIEVRIKTTEMLAQKGDTHGQQEVIVDRLMELHKRLQVIVTDYQILSQMLISFFRNLAELEKTIETLQSQYQLTRLPSAVSEVELLLKEHEASRQAVLELFKFTQNESEQIITRIRQQEPQVAAQHDIQRVTVLLEEKRHSWELAWTERKMQLEQHQQLCQFDSDLQLINSSLSDLSTQLFAIRGQYGESSASAKATSLAFVYFEKTIELLQLRIQTFVSTAEQMLLSEHVSSPHIERELKMLQTRWAAFHNQVVESRRLIDLSIEYFKLVEEAEEWFREGSKLLLTIARKSTTVKLPEEATQLLNEVEIFLKPGETRQDERIREISKLAVELYGEERSKQVKLVLNENQEMMDSFTVISLELSTLAKNLKAAEEQRERQKKEQEEVDASLAAARAEAAAAKAAAAAAEEARKAAETAAKALQEAAPFLQEARVAYASPLPPSEHEGEKSRKSPSPPLKKAKFFDETPRPMAPVFTVPLHDAAIQEGARFTFECRVSGFPMPEVTWYKDGIAIQNNPDYQTTFDQGVCTLTIEETFTEDSAKFICKAVNAAGTAETNATLSVKEAEPEEQLSPPVFTKRLEPGTAQEGSAFQMECKVEGNPLPTVQWFKNDVCIDNSPDYAITYNNGEAVLRFEEVFLEDQVEYCCKAVNQLGTDVCSAKLNVEPLEPTEAPSFITPLSNVMARAGQKIKLECEVTGLPTPAISWNHNGKLLQETHDIRMQYDDKKVTLVVNEAFPKDAGVYVVSAKNIAGEATSSCNVSVKGRLPTETSDSELASDMEPVKPAIQLSLKDVSVFEGQQVRLDCIIVGQPEPEVIWYHNDRPVKESTDIKLLFQGDRCSLVIEEAYLEDAGEYKVVAINSGGEASSKCSLSVKSVGETDPAIRGQLVEVIEPAGIAPKFSQLLTDILAPEGNKVTFECCVNGDPKPNIKWYLNNEEIHHSSHIQLNHDDEGNVSLTIPEVLPEHKGVYTVKAYNTCGEAKCFASLIVKSISSPEIKHKTAEIQGKHVAPAFQELFADRTVNENETTKFECVITGKPVPKVEWYFNDGAVSGKNFLVSSSGDRHTLAIFQTSPAHSGVVACVAENEAGKATCVARLSVRTKSPAELNIPPHESSIISEHQESSSFTMKRSVIVHSSSSQVTSSVSTANSEPNVQVQSYTSQSEERFEQIGDNHPVQVESQKTEEVHQESQDKAIVHQETILKVVNGVADHQETVQATSSTPTYSPKTTRKSTAPRFISPLNGKIVDQGADVILDAVVDGYPQPTVTWHKNGQELSPKDTCVIISWELNHARLELRNVAVKDAGRYTCKAVNSVGSASSTADVVVKKTIFPPVFGRRLQASVAKAGERVSMNVEVTGTPDPVVTWFKDNQKILGAVPGGPFKTKIQGNSYSLIIDKAAPSHSGTYRVKAENAGGEAECIADFIVSDTEPQTEQNLQMMTHVVFKDVREETIQQSDHHHQTRSSDVTTEPETTQRRTAETGTSPISLSPHRTSPSLGKPITTESTTVTESMKTEKIFSIKVERTPSPSFHKLAEEAHTTKEVQTPVSVEKKPQSAPSISEVKQIRQLTEEHKSDREEFFEIQDSKITEEQFLAQDIPQTPRKEQEFAETGIESGSISKKSALDFFVSKISEKESDIANNRHKEPEVIPLKTSVKENISQFEGLHLKEYDQLYRPQETVIYSAPIMHDKTDDTGETMPKPSPPHVGDLSRDLPSLVSKTEKKQHSSEIQSETHKETPSRDSQIQELPRIPQSVKFNTFPLQSSKSQLHTEESRFEKHITQHYVHHSLSSLDGFNLQPEPPPEIGYIPKTEVPAKLRLDMPSRVKKLEESHRVLSPVEIPSGAVRIFPAPIRPETPTAEKCELQPKPQKEDKLFIETLQTVSLSDKEKLIEEELTKREIVEQMSVQKKVQLPGTADWTFQHPVSTTQPVIEEHAAPTKPVSQPQTASFAPVASALSTTAVQPPWRTQTIRTGTQQSALESVRSMSPRPSAEALAMERLWASHRTPEPEVVDLPVAPIKETQLPKPPVAESVETYVSSTITKSSVQETDIRRAASPRPSAEGIAMEKLWTPHKTVEPECAVTRPVATGQQEFEKAMSPKPSMEGLAMDKIWAHKHPDSALRKAWPPAQPMEEKPVIPWAVKGNVERIWPPPEPIQAVHQEVDSKSQKEIQVQQEETKIVKHPVKEVKMASSEVKTDHRTVNEETRSSTLHTQTTPAPTPPNIQHYVAEARVVHSSAVLQTEVKSTTISTEHLEVKSENTEHTEIVCSTLPGMNRTSPPVVEEKMLRPSEAKRLWPPGVKDEYELKSPPILKDVPPRKETLPKPKPVQEVTTETFLEPGPPPEIGFAPAPPVERRQSLVETIEQDIQRDLEKEPTRHIVGAVRTLPSPPLKEKTAPPPLPPKEKSVPPPLPPKEKVPEIKSVPPLKKEIKKPVVKEKPFERFPDLEPFPFQPDEAAPKPAKCPPPPKPTKFIKGEFASSDYESDIESVHISSKWRPYESDTEEVIGYRKVVPPALKQPRRPKSTEPDPLPPSKFDQPPQFFGPPRPTVDKVQASKKGVKELETEISKVTSKIEMKTEKVKKHHHYHHHAPELKRRHSPPTLKLGSPPIFVQPAAASAQDGEAKPATDEKKGEPVTPPKTKPDSPKFKTKTTQSEFPESGYMADTDEPRHLRQASHKYSHFKHEESSKVTVEHTTVVTSEISEQSAQSVQQQQQKSEKLLPTKPHPSPKFHHRHSDHKSDKKAVASSTTALSKAEKDLPTSTAVTDVTHMTQVYKEEKISNLEPFPFKAEPQQPTVERIVGPPPPSPSKFVKREFRESDYESDYDSKIPAKWRPYDSDADEPSYRPVRPVLTPGGRQSHSQASLEVRTPTPPTEFDNPPQFGGPPRPKFEPIEKPSTPVKSETRKPEKPQKVFKPTAVIPKPPSPIEVIVATPAVKEPDVILQPGTPPELGYAPPPHRTAPYQNATQMETSKVMKFAESTEHSHRVVSVQQTTRVIKFGDKEKKVPPEPKLEPFPFKPEPERPHQKSGPPPSMPKKFIPGEFRESDYESDYEGIRIKPKWAPGDSDTDEPHYRKIRLPPVTRSTSVPAKPSDSVPTPMEFDMQPVVLPSPVTVESKTKSVSALDLESERKRLKRVEELRNRFSVGAASSVQKKTTVAAKDQASVEESQQVLIKPGEPPEFGFVPASASYVASKHMSEMTNTFKSKAQQFVDDIMTDVKSAKENGHVEEPKATISSAENDPQAFREESRVSEYGTKLIDPDTGLIYFKYDFGYEFGVILPGEGDKKRKHVQIEKKRDDDIEVPVIHETSGSEKKVVGHQPNADSGKVPQFRPKKFSHYKSVKWEPVSESEMSEAEGDSIQQHKKRYSMPQPPVGGFQKAPHILIPQSSQWDQASPSPVSLSPSLPSLSPHYGGQGPHGTTCGVDLTASPGGSWQGLSPNRGPRSQGRGSTPTPPSTPSTPGSVHGAVGHLTQPRKPPTFITPLRDIAVVSGQNARFECIVQAEPPPNILWSKNGRIIDNSQNYQIQYRNGVCRLTIPQAFPEDAGSYTCTATNMLGTVATTGSLQVPGERRSVHV